MALDTALTTHVHYVLTQQAQQAQQAQQMQCAVRIMQYLLHIR